MYRMHSLQYVRAQTEIVNQKNHRCKIPQKPTPASNPMEPHGNSTMQDSSKINPRGSLQRLHRRRVRAARHMLLPLLDIETTGFSRRWHEITVIGTIAYDAAARAEREHRCFNVFCVRLLRARSRHALARRRGVDETRCRLAPRVLTPYIGIQFDLPWIRQWQLQSPARGSGAVAADLPGHGRRRI